MIARLVFILVALAFTASAEPPFTGTIFMDRNILTADDPTTYSKTIGKGRGWREMFDRRIGEDGAFVKVKARLFRVRFKDSPAIEVQVNPELGRKKEARKLAIKYGREIGRLPKVLRTEVHFVWIHAGVKPFGGGNSSLLIHTGQSALYESDGILDETLFHEACHTSLDASHAASASWRAAQASDAEFISTYARDNPCGEDIAESFLPWFAVRYRSGRIAPALASKITTTIPARLSYFDAQRFSMSPVR